MKTHDTLLGSNTATVSMPNRTSDVMLIVKLCQRVADPANKGTLELSMDDFEFYRCDWSALDDREVSE